MKRQCACGGELYYHATESELMNIRRYLDINDVYHIHDGNKAMAVFGCTECSDVSYSASFKFPCPGCPDVEDF